MKPSAIAISIFALLIFFAAFGLYNAATTDQSPVALHQMREIRIGYAIEPPYAFLDGNGNVTGAFPEAARAIAEGLGITEINWIKTEFSELIPELRAGRFDVVAAGLYITEERAAVVDFSAPLLVVPQDLLVRQTNPRNLHAYEDALRDASITLAVVAGSAEERLLHRLGLPSNQLLVVPDARSGQQSVLREMADGLALSAPTVHWMAEHDPQAQLVSAWPFQQPDPAFTRDLGPCGFAFQQDDDKLRIIWNQQMQTWMQSPAYDRVLTKFGFTTLTTKETYSR